MNANENQINEFRKLVWEFYRAHGRDLPWRRDITPYGVFVSEIMLQQTQVARVLERWPRWMRRFDGFEELAAASAREVLEEWQGMGYNRRALWLRSAAEVVVGEYGGELPREAAELMRLPGVGPNTAGSIAAFAYDEPVVFIETNIRRVFLHEFFAGADDVHDRELRPLIEGALDRDHPRQWYYALMDLGADLARRVPNPNRRSRHHTVQSRFEGSLRQVRGEVLRQLLAGAKTQLEFAAVVPDERLGAVLEAMLREGFIVNEGTHITLAK